MTFALIVVAGYLAGSCPWGHWLVRIFRHEDIRKHGSGGTGGSNVWRSFGPKLAIPVIVLDVLKGFAPAFVGVLAVSHLCGILAGVAAMLGHARPIFLRFEKGGKMVATGGGVLLAVCPLVAGSLIALWAVTFLLSRYTSLASIVAAIALPVLTIAYGYPVPVICFGVATGLAVLLLHRSNLRRLRAGTEHRFKGLKGLRRTSSASL